VRESGADIVPFDLPQLRAAQDAYRRFGKGRHPAGLNFGECMSYAPAKVCDKTLLFKGNDFACSVVTLATLTPCRLNGVRRVRLQAKLQIICF